MRMNVAIRIFGGLVDRLADTSLTPSLESEQKMLHSEKPSHKTVFLANVAKPLPVWIIFGTILVFGDLYLNCHNIEPKYTTRLTVNDLVTTILIYSKFGG